MPSRLLEITVRSDWKEIDRLWAARGARAWRGAQIAVLVAVLTSVLLGTLAPRWPALRMARLTIFTLVTWAPPLWYLIHQTRGRRRAPLALAKTLAVLTIATLGAIATAPNGMAGPLQLPLPFALLIPAATWSLLAYEWRQTPPASRALGFVLGDWFYFAMTGAAAGIALGFHMLLVAHYLPAIPDAQWTTLPQIVWLACYVLGLRATGEELLLRGLGFYLLAGSTVTLPTVVARITALNLLLYLILLSQSTHPALWLLGLVYTVLLSVATTLLRYRSSSLIPALACNAAASLLIAAVLPW